MADPLIKSHARQTSAQQARDALLRAFRRNQAFGLLLIAALVLLWSLDHTNLAWIFPHGWWRP